MIKLHPRGGVNIIVYPASSRWGLRWIRQAAWDGQCLSTGGAAGAPGKVRGGSDRLGEITPPYVKRRDFTTSASQVGTPIGAVPRCLLVELRGPHCPDGPRVLEAGCVIGVIPSELKLVFVVFSSDFLFTDQIMSVYSDVLLAQRGASSERNARAVIGFTVQSKWGGLSMNPDSGQQNCGLMPEYAELNSQQE